MSRAEEAALEAYPEDIWIDVNYYGFVPDPPKKDYNKERRAICQQGYELAEKDLALSIDDIEKIHTFLYAVKNNKHGVFTFTRLSDEQYKEVLRRFNKAKEEKK